MTTKSMNELLGRVISDEVFRKELSAAPEATLNKARFEASPEVIEAIRAVDPADLSAMARDYEKVSAGRKAAI